MCPLVPNGSPQDFNISVTPTTVTLSWSLPLSSQRNGVITGYFVNCTVGGVIESIRLNGTIYDIFTEPFTSYSCTVSAATVVGDGPATAVISGVTDEDSECSSLLWILKILPNPLYTLLHIFLLQHQQFLVTCLEFLMVLDHCLLHGKCL